MADLMRFSFTGKKKENVWLYFYLWCFWIKTWLEVNYSVNGLFQSFLGINLINLGWESCRKWDLKQKLVAIASY